MKANLWVRPDVGSYQFEETFNRYLPPCSCVKSSLSNTPLARIRETCSINGVLALACDISRLGLPLFFFTNTLQSHVQPSQLHVHVQHTRTVYSRAFRTCVWPFPAAAHQYWSIVHCWFRQRYINNCMAISFYCGFLQEFWRLNRWQNLI